MRLDLTRREQIGDWHHAQYGGIRRFRALWAAPHFLLIRQCKRRLADELSETLVIAEVLEELGIILHEHRALLRQMELDGGH